MTSSTRKDHEPPAAIARHGWRFHHVGIPTDESRPGEHHIPHLGMHVSGFATSPWGIEWMRFDTESPVHELIRRVPHVAFEVDDLEAALAALDEPEILSEASSPSEGVRVVMLLDDGAPVELMEFRSPSPPGT